MKILNLWCTGNAKSQYFYVRFEKSNNSLHTRRIPKALFLTLALSCASIPKNQSNLSKLSGEQITKFSKEFLPLVDGDVQIDAPKESSEKQLKFFVSKESIFDLNNQLKLHQPDFVVGVDKVKKYYKISCSKENTIMLYLKHKAINKTRTNITCAKKIKRCVFDVTLNNQCHVAYATLCFAKESQILEEVLSLNAEVIVLLGFEDTTFIKSNAYQTLLDFQKKKEEEKIKFFDYFSDIYKPLFAKYQVSYFSLSNQMLVVVQKSMQVNLVKEIQKNVLYFNVDLQEEEEKKYESPPISISPVTPKDINSPLVSYYNVNAEIQEKIQRKKQEEQARRQEEQAKRREQAKKQEEEDNEKNRILSQKQEEARNKKLQSDYEDEHEEQIFEQLEKDNNVKNDPLFKTYQRNISILKDLESKMEEEPENNLLKIQYLEKVLSTLDIHNRPKDISTQMYLDFFGIDKLPLTNGRFCKILQLNMHPDKFAEQNDKKYKHLLGLHFQAVTDFCKKMPIGQSFNTNFSKDQFTSNIENLAAQLHKFNEAKWIEEENSLNQ